LKLLLDQNLSHRLLNAVHSLCPESRHVREFGLDRASDDEIWQYAAAHDFCVVTQDTDFSSAR
jgi:predicted nuclease of predicted toxin-antitoxin system